LVDLDLDGVPELTYDGKEADVAGGLAIAVDRADDGRRVQWLVAPAGVDPRDRAQVWLYRDCRRFWITVDTDGDGKSNCHWGGCIE
jgi:hypothetical protein